MARELTRLTSKLYNSPLLISEKSLSSINAFLAKRNMGDWQSSEPECEEEDESFYELYGEDSNIGVITIHGALTYRETGWEAMCGGQSYLEILEDTKELIEAGAKHIILDIDSGGGEAYGCFESANQFKQMCVDAGVKTYAYVDGDACSAAYGFGCVVDEFIVNPDSETGNIGVLVKLMNDSEHLKQEGYERTFVFAGKNKIPFAADGSFSEAFLSSIQTKVDFLYSEFAKHVAENRSMSVEAVIATNADAYLADEAVSSGLADKKMTRADFAAYIDTQTKKDSTQMFKLFQMKKDKDGVQASEFKDVEELMSNFAAVSQEKEALAEQLASFQASHNSVVEELAQAKEALAKYAEAEAAAVKAKAEAKVEERKAALSAVLGDDKAEAAMAEMSGVSDSVFAMMLSTATEAQKAEANSELFKEVGANGAQASKEEQNLTQKMIQEKYHTNKE